jgi:hypothetical protein
LHSPIIIIEDDPATPIAEDLLLTDEDFPPTVVDKRHPNDYKLTTEPITKELIFHEIEGRHSRLILRTSVKLAENLFTSMSVVLDTGAPKIYLCTEAAALPSMGYTRLTWTWG